MTQSSAKVIQNQFGSVVSGSSMVLMEIIVQNLWRSLSEEKKTYRNILAHDEIGDSELSSGSFGQMHES